jgi:hypothetical protein
LARLCFFNIQSSTLSIRATSDTLAAAGGSQDEAVAAQLADKELLKQFKEVELLSPEDKHLVKTFIDAFITKRHVQELAK